VSSPILKRNNTSPVGNGNGSGNNLSDLAFSPNSHPNSNLKRRPTLPTSNSNSNASSPYISPNNPNSPPQSPHKNLTSATFGNGNERDNPESDQSQVARKPSSIMKTPTSAVSLDKYSLSPLNNSPNTPHTPSPLNPSFRKLDDLKPFRSDSESETDTTQPQASNFQEPSLSAASAALTDKEKAKERRRLAREEQLRRYQEREEQELRDSLPRNVSSASITSSNSQPGSPSRVRMGNSVCCTPSFTLLIIN
jgi:hypothetical protein